MDVGWCRNKDDGWQGDQEGDHRPLVHHGTVVSCVNVRIYSQCNMGICVAVQWQCNSSICTDVTRQSSDIR